jgi:Arabinose efflux permease
MSIDATIDSVPFDPAREPDLAARNRLVIGLLLVSTFVVFLNETIMSVAIPHLMTDLGVTASAAQWLTTAFLLTMAVVIPITGFLLQRLNTRPIFLIAMSTFALEHCSAPRRRGSSCWCSGAWCRRWARRS